MANTMTGRVHMITPVQEIKGKSGNSFHKRLLVIDAKRYDPVTGEPKFDNYPSFEFSGDGMKLLDGLAVGDCVTVSYDINGREFVDPDTREARYFNTLRGYKVEPYGKKEAAPAPTPQPEAVAASTAQGAKAEPLPPSFGQEGGLPF